MNHWLFWNSIVSTLFIMVFWLPMMVMFIFEGFILMLWPYDPILPPSKEETYYELDGTVHLWYKLLSLDSQITLPYIVFWDTITRDATIFK